MIDNSIYIDHLPIIKVDLEVIKEIVDLLLLNFESKKIPTITFKMFRNETVVTANSLVEIESILSLSPELSYLSKLDITIYLYDFKSDDIESRYVNVTFSKNDNIAYISSNSNIWIHEVKNKVESFFKSKRLSIISSIYRDRMWISIIPTYIGLFSPLIYMWLLPMSLAWLFFVGPAIGISLFLISITFFGIYSLFF